MAKKPSKSLKSIYSKKAFALLKEIFSAAWVKLI